MASNENSGTSNGVIVSSVWVAISVEDSLGRVASRRVLLGVLGGGSIGGVGGVQFGDFLFVRMS